MSQPSASPLIDTRWIFGAYVVSAASCGGYLLLSSQNRFPGTLLIGLALLAIPALRSKDEQLRHSVCGWFALAHALVAWGLHSVQMLPKWTDDVVLGISMLFFYTWILKDGQGHLPRPLTTIFGDNRFGESLDPALPLRSRYEEQIRLAAAQEERHRLARDLHDSVKQQLFVIQTSAAAAQERIAGDQQGAAEAVRQVRVASREALAEMQAMLDQLQAEPLENTGLVAAIRKQCEAFGFRSGAKVEVSLGELPSSDTWAPGTHETLLRIVQESLSNAARHSRAANLTVSLRPLHNKVVLSVQDDGSGFDPATVPAGMGLENMRRRAKETGATLEVISSPGAGTEIRFAVPYTVPRKKYYGCQAIVYGCAAVMMITGMVWRQKFEMIWFLAFVLVNFTANLSGWRRGRAK